MEFLFFFAVSAFLAVKYSLSSLPSLHWFASVQIPSSRGSPIPRSKTGRFISAFCFLNFCFSTALPAEGRPNHDKSISVIAPTLAFASRLQPLFGEFSMQFRGFCIPSHRQNEES
jgi:hypothetical protein